MMKWMRARSALPAVLALGAIALGLTPVDALAALRVCADPGNMPLSNNKGEGFENKIAAVLAKALDTTVENYFRPGIERGLTRSTLDADQCDVMIDMPVDSEDVAHHEPAVPHDLRAGVSQRPWPTTSRTSMTRAFEEAEDRGLRDLGNPGGAGRPRRGQRADSLPEP